MQSLPAQVVQDSSWSCSSATEARQGDKHEFRQLTNKLTDIIFAPYYDKSEMVIKEFAAPSNIPPLETTSASYEPRLFVQYNKDNRRRVDGVITSTNSRRHCSDTGGKCRALRLHVINAPRKACTKVFMSKALVPHRLHCL